MLLSQTSLLNKLRVGLRFDELHLLLLQSLRDLTTLWISRILEILESDFTLLDCWMLLFDVECMSLQVLVLLLFNGLLHGVTQAEVHLESRIKLRQGLCGEISVFGIFEDGLHLLIYSWAQVHLNEVFCIFNETFLKSCEDLLVNSISNFLTFCVLCLGIC